MPNNMTPIVFDHDLYNKISDDLCFLSSNSAVRFNTTLYTLNKDNVKNNFHSEFLYNDSNGDNAISIKRKFNYYISIEIWDFENYKDKEYVIIGINDIINLRIGLEKVYDLFNNNQYDNLFGKKNGRYILLKRVDPIIISNFPQDKQLIFEPNIIEYNDGNAIGVRMSTNFGKNFCNITLEALLGFKYQIDSINMYETAISMLNYIGRPEYGHNLVTFDQSGGSYNNRYNHSSRGVIGRTVNGER